MRQKEKIREMEREITRLFGESSYRVERRACTGRYRGHNDYSLVFGSGRRLYIGLDLRNYAGKLREALEHIRNFRAKQSENTERIRTVILENHTPFRDASVEIRPYDGTPDLCVYAVVILTRESGARFVYRETNMHYYLVGGGGGWCSFERCVQAMLQDFRGGMRLTEPLTREAA